VRAQAGRGDDFLRVHQSLNGKIIDNEKLYEKISTKQNFSGGKKRHPARAIKKAARAAHFFSNHLQFSTQIPPFCHSVSA